MDQEQHGDAAASLLGYPADARLLIINADDLGLCHAINAAIFPAITQGVVTSTSLMVPCPWARHAMHLLGQTPALPFGVHLTVICETDYYRWGPLTAREHVPSLIDETGNFYSPARIPEFVEKASLPELETEFRAQIEAVLAAGLKPTHLDWHCLRNGGRPDIFDLTLSLARDYGLAVRVTDQPMAGQLQSRGLPTNEHGMMDSFRLDIRDKSARYAELLHNLPAGLSEWAVHPGLDNAELQTIQPDGARVRQTDFDFLMSPEAAAIIQREGIILLSYRPLQAIWQTRS